MVEEKRLALLIDSDNIAAKNSAFILEAAKKYGNLVYKRIYGDWEKTNSGWRIPATNNSILQIQQNSYIAGKNATDFSIVIDAMDILYTGNVDGFVLVTSDSDFTRLAIRLREAGKLVVGIGSVQTPLAFSSSCHEFIYINASNEEREEITESKLKSDIVQYVKDNDDGKLELAKINAFLNGKYGNIDYTLFGSNRLSSYIDSIPEVMRRGNYVMSTQKSGSPAPTKNQPSDKEIADLIVQYLKRKTNCQDDLSRVMAYITQTFGKIDFSRFGSKHFSKYIDRHRALFVRDKNVMYLAKGVSDLTPTKPVTAAETSAPEKPVEKPVDKSVEKSVDKPVEKKPQPSKPMSNYQRVAKELFDAEVREYAKDNSPNGGNLGQLNNMLLYKFGRDYTSELGYADFASALSTVTGVTVRKNFVFIDEDNESDTAEKPVPTENTAADNSEKETEKTADMTERKVETHAVGTEKSDDKAERKAEAHAVGIEKSDDKTNHKAEAHAVGAEKSDDKAKRKAEANTTRAEKPENSEDAQIKSAAKREQERQRPEINAVKRDILGFAANSEGGQLPELGKLLNEKYGRGYLKELGFPTVKKLAASMNGLYVKGNALYFEKEFLERTDKIEQLVYDFARSDGPHGVKALSTLIKKSVENFDFTDYGYAKISDFINAVDGVCVKGRYVEPDDE